MYKLNSQFLKIKIIITPNKVVFLFSQFVLEIKEEFSMDDKFEIYYKLFKSPIGEIFVASTPLGLCRVGINSDLREEMIWFEEKFSNFSIEESDDQTQIYVSQLIEYFEGNRKEFDIPVFLIGTNFQKRVWKALTEIPYGKTASYKEIALKVSNPKGVRAVGQVNNKNPIPIVIPCHRIIGSNGELTGYGVGLEIKKWLLELEANNSCR